MGKVKCIIEMDEDEYKRVKNAECSYDGFEKGTFGYYLNIIQKTATPITGSDDCVSRQAVMALLDKWYCHKEPYERKEGNTVYKGYDTYYMINFDKLKALPSVLPKREQGEWLEVHPLQEDDGGAYMCSQCRCGHPYIAPHWKYCPNCGADMR